jgi:hypothetical protein
MRLQRPAWWVGGLALLLRTALSAQGQGTFQNLGFESASLVPISGPTVQFAPAFPGWTASVGGSQLTTALYNDINLDTSGISIIDSGWSYFSVSAGVIQGNYTAILQAGLYGTTPANMTLSQTGLVPGTAQSLQFKAYAPGFSSPLFPLVVMLGGQQLSCTPLGSGANYTLYGADIHTFAGQTAELDFTVLAENPHVNNNYVSLDSIIFSNQPVPEPGVVGLWALGAVLFGWRVVRRR